MVEPMRTVLDRDEAARDYKPLALAAVAAIAVSLLFSSVVVVLTIVGLVARKSVLVPWLIPLAFSGLLLSIAARWQISLSEGTREGRRLSSIAWWISLLGGAIYTAYYFGNVYAIQTQARDFVREAYLDKLKDREFEKAYVSTIQPTRRIGMDLREIQQRFGDPVKPFRAERLSRMLEFADGKVEIESRGTTEWRESAKGIEVITRFLVRTPEGTFEALIPAIGSNNPETGLREWYVERNTTLLPVSLKVLGHLTDSLRAEADSFLGAWLYKRGPADRYLMYLEARPLTPQDRQRKYAEYIMSTAMAPGLADLFGTVPVATVPTRIGLWLVRPDMLLEDLHPEIKLMGRDLVRWDESKHKRSAAEKEKMLPLILTGNHIARHSGPTMMNAGQPHMEVFPDRIQVSVALEVSLPILNYRCQGRLYAVCKDEKMVQEIIRRRDDLAEDRRSEKEKDVEAKKLLATLSHDWQISEVVIDLAKDLSDVRPGGGTPMMPGMRLAIPD